MKKQSLVLLVSLISTVLAAQSSLAQTAAPVFTAQHFRAHVAFLADDLLEGRDTGSRGHEVAALYVASQFEAFGLKPAGENGTWYQRVTFQQTDRGAAKGSFTITGPGGETRRFDHGTDVTVWTNADEPQLDVSADLVFV